MKRKNTLFIVSLVSLLSACSFNGNSSLSSSTSNNQSESVQSSSVSSVIDKDHYEEQEPVLAPDSDLATFDELPYVYDNKIKMQGGQEVPDPFVYRFNGHYYLYPTTGGGAVKAFKSDDLFNWESIGNVYEYRSDGSAAPDSQTPFAPEVTYFNGMFYMIASPSGNGHYVFSSESPEGPFTCISENIGHNIDGSFFIDGNEDIYLFGASNGSIKAYKLDDDMHTFLEDDSGTELSAALSTCRVGGWNEGPYMLQRNGSYYMTYCGTHYLSKDYRIDYAYCKEGSDVFKDSSYTREDTIAISTEDSFNGLGHSSTVLGPDMDSYYLVYHNLEPSSSRYLNLSRLSFNCSMMVANDVKEKNLVGTDLPPFYSYDISEGYDSVGNYYLSQFGSEESFTVEFNVAGEGKMIFSYVDESNYSYMEYVNNAITINKVIDGNKSEKYKIELIKEYDNSVMHTFRLQYHKGKMNIYFDNMEKAYGIDAYFVGGKMGYEINNNFIEIGYTAYSNVALGSSDSKAYNSKISLANAYDEKLSYLTGDSRLQVCESKSFVQEDNYDLVIANENDRATYRVYEEEGDYTIEMRMPSSNVGKTIGVRVDDGDIQKFTITADGPSIYKKGDMKVSIGSIYLTEGQHNISIYNVGDEISFSEIFYVLNDTEAEFGAVFDESFTTDECRVRNSLNLNKNGINSDNQESCGIITKAKFRNATVESEINLKSINDFGYVSVLLNVSDYNKKYNGDADGAESLNCYRGYQFRIDGNMAYLIYTDFNFSKTLKQVALSNFAMNTYVTLKISQENNKYTCYIDDEEIISVVYNIGNLYGNIGVIASRCDATISSLFAYCE